ncbi:MAG: hypothetical protein ABI700_33000 [Chloroflexota bacterium]
MSVQEMIQEARALSPDEIKLLMRALIDMMPANAASKKRSIFEFEGIATHLADEEDPQEYLKRLRSEWDDPS